MASQISLLGVGLIKRVGPIFTMLCDSGIDYLTLHVMYFGEYLGPVLMGICCIILMYNVHSKLILLRLTNPLFFIHSLLSSMFGFLIFLN